MIKKSSCCNQKEPSYEAALRVYPDAIFSFVNAIGVPFSHELMKMTDGFIRNLIKQKYKAKFTDTSLGSDLIRSESVTVMKELKMILQ